MDLSALPTFYALAIFVCCFRPLVRRAGPHTNVWFVGWTFLLIHYLRLLLPELHGIAESLVELVGIWSGEFSCLCFLLAASNERANPYNRIFALEIAIPVLLQSVLFLFNANHPLLQIANYLLFALPALHLFLRPKNRTKALNRLSGAFVVLAAGLIVFRRIGPHLTLGIIFGMIFFSAAYLLFAYASKITRGVALMIVGLILWGITCPLEALRVLDPEILLGRAILDLPRYILAAGMILSFLDDYVSRAEMLALHDPLTGLPNRRLFENRLEAALEESRLSTIPVACLVIDVDNFKYINDTHGHPVGDGLLQALSKRLSWNLGPRDMLARTGGDEFTAVIVEAGDEFHVRFIAGAMMAAGCVPVSIQDHSIDVKISVGIAVSSRSNYDMGELHKSADDAMYRAKRSGGGTVVFANDEMPHHPLLVQDVFATGRDYDGSLRQ